MDASSEGNDEDASIKGEHIPSSDLLLDGEHELEEPEDEWHGHKHPTDGSNSNLFGDNLADLSQRSSSIESPQEAEEVGAISSFKRRMFSPFQTVLLQKNVADVELPQFLDHYTLPTPSSSIRFRSGNVHVYSSHGSQMILEERITMKGGLALAMTSTDEGGASHSDHNSNGLAGGKGDKNKSAKAKVNITVKKANYSTNGLFFLKTLYAGIAVFIGTFIFILGVGILLFVISDLAYKGWSDWYPFAGTFLSIPVLLDGFSQVMAALTGFVIDVFSGHPLLRSFGWGEVVTNWMTVVAFILTPAIPLLGSFFGHSEDFWKNTLITSFISVSAFFCVFGLNVIYYRVSSALLLVEELERHKASYEMSFLSKVKRSMMTATYSALSGKERKLYIFDSDSYDLREMAVASDDSLHMYQVKGRLYISFTKLLARMGLFETLDIPHRSWTTDEINGDLPFVTRTSWSLESVFCRSRTQSNVVVIGGTSAVTRRQVISSIVFDFLGSFLYLLLLVAILEWFDFGSVLVSVITVIFLAYWARKIEQDFKLSKKLVKAIDTYQGVTSAAEDEDVCRGLLQKWEALTITQPTPAFMCFYLTIQFIAMFAFPLSYLIYSKNTSGTLIFVLMSILCFERRFLDVGPILEELGSYGHLRRGERSSFGGLLGEISEQQWQQKSRIYRIQGLSRRIWYLAFVCIMLLFAVVVLGAIINNDGIALETDTSGTTASHDPQDDPWITFPSDGTYYYQEPQSYVPRLCTLDSFGSIEPGSEGIGPMKYLADYAFLSNIPYFKVENYQPLLNTWFGNNQAIFEDTAVIDFLKSHPEFVGSLASYQLVTFPEPSTAIVCVRGTNNFFDFLEDAKLWYSSALFQLVRAALPLGHLFDPLIEFSANFLSQIEEASINHGAYYHETSSFVRDLKDSGKYESVELTGHSLGGGIALISGAQTHTTAVGLSAPNTVIGRDTLRPQVTQQELLEWTFNIVPQRDIFPKIGSTSGQEENMARIGCTASSANSFSCHEAARSLCEMLYSCGNLVARPVFCECVTIYGYPSPKVNDEGPTFEEACSDVLSLHAGLRSSRTSLSIER